MLTDLFHQTQMHVPIYLKYYGWEAWLDFSELANP